MNGLIIDNFAGGGGASTGIEKALGRSPDVAINHDPEAVAMHMANHPDTEHYCQSVTRADPKDVTRGQPVALAWFSPDCTHHSKAKGGTPRKKHIRDLAWVVVLWAERVKPAVMILENVEEFRDWGPLDAEGQPIPERKGETFDYWVRQIRKRGYKVQWKELRACDYGAPTIRKRLFLVARRDGLPIVWPKPTHEPGLIPHRTAADIIDWSLPCPSIFERKRPLAENTLKSIARGIRKYVIKAKEPFVVSYAQQGGRNRSAFAPLHTITASRKDQNCIIMPHLSRQFGQGIGRGVDEPAPTVTAGGMGKTAMVMAFLAKHYGGVTGIPVTEPTGTVTTKDHHALVTSHIVNMQAGNIGHDARSPLHTITASGTHFGEVRAFLLKYYGQGSRDQDCRDPLHTVTTKDHFGLVTVDVDEYRIADIGMRMLSPRELFRAQGFPDSYVIAPDYNGKPLTKTAQVRMCGNSVCPDIASALVEANLAKVNLM